MASLGRKSIERIAKLMRATFVGAPRKPHGHDHLCSVQSRNDE
jgi:hypothetical protein